MANEKKGRPQVLSNLNASSKAKFETADLVIKNYGFGLPSLHVYPVHPNVHRHWLGFTQVPPLLHPFLHIAVKVSGQVSRLNRTGFSHVYQFNFYIPQLPLSFDIVRYM